VEYLSVRPFNVCSAIAARVCAEATGAAVEVHTLPNRSAGLYVFRVADYQKVDAVIEWVESMERTVVEVLPWDSELGWGVVVA
jgi:hypothetical protein